MRWLYWIGVVHCTVLWVIATETDLSIWLTFLVLFLSGLPFLLLKATIEKRNDENGITRTLEN